MRLILPVLATLVLAGCNPEDFGPSDRYKDDFHYTLKPSERFSIEDFNGDVEIAGWDQPSIEITGTKYASTEENLRQIKVDVHESPSLTEIRTSHPTTFHGNQGARFFIQAPRKTVIERASSSNGKVRIHDMTAGARIHTSNGAINVENTTGGVNADTSNGAIELDTVAGKLKLKTSNGRIHAEEITGACEAETSNGPVNLNFKDAADGPLHIHTSNGSVELTFPKSPKSEINAETSNGSITLNLPGGTSAHLNAHTSGSSVSSDFDVTDRDSPDKQKHNLEGNIGAGGPLIELSTHNGGIHVKKTSASAN